MARGSWWPAERLDSLRHTRRDVHEPLRERVRAIDSLIVAGEAERGLALLEATRREHPGVPLVAEVVLVPAVEKMTIRGLDEAMSPEQQAEMKKAVADVQKMKAQMAQMPPAAQKMLKGQIERLEKMAGSGGSSLVEAIVYTLHAVANEGPPHPGGIGYFTIGGVAFERAMTTATWQSINTSGYFQEGWLFFPASLEFAGGMNGFQGHLSIRGISDTNTGGVDVDRWEIGSVSGELVRPDGSRETFSYEGGHIHRTMISYTEARGEAQFEGGNARFMVGHMPCSDAPRSLMGGRSWETHYEEEWGDLTQQAATKGKAIPEEFGEFEPCVRLAQQHE